MTARSGERRLQILQALAEMLQSPEAEKITTAALASRLGVSEAALYRHFASKAQMFEGLIEFIEQTLFSLINRIAADDSPPLRQLEAMLMMLLGFAQKNPGMTRVLTGDALVHENGRLQARINQLHDRLELSFRQALRLAAAQSVSQPAAQADPMVLANLLLSYVIGRWHQYAKSGFRRDPTAQAAEQLAYLLGLSADAAPQTAQAGSRP